MIPSIGDKQLGSISTQRKAIGTKRRKTSGRQEAVMFDSDHVARPIAFACAVDLKDRSLERVRNIKIAVSIESKRVGGRKAITAKHDRVLAHIWIIYLSIGWRSAGRNLSHVFNFRRISKVGRNPLNLGSAKVADIDLVIPTVKLKPQERRPAKVSLGDELAVFSKP